MSRRVSAFGCDRRMAAERAATSASALLTPLAQDSLGSVSRRNDLCRTGWLNVAIPFSYLVCALERRCEFEEHDFSC